MHSFIHLFIHSFIRSFTHSLLPPTLLTLFSTLFCLSSQPTHPTTPTQQHPHHQQKHPKNKLATAQISANFVSMYMEEFEEIPWDALKFLVASINYGGHVVDEWDKRLLNVYISEFFVEDVINTNFYKCVPLCVSVLVRVCEFSYPCVCSCV